MNRPFVPIAVDRVARPVALVALAPVLLAQAWWTVRRTPRLDPAAGDEQGVADGAGVAGGAEPEFRLVVIGESTAAGVGASLHAQALPGFLAEALRDRLRRSVAWSVAGRNGATVRTVITDLIPARGGPPPEHDPAGGAAGTGGAGGATDLVVVAVGVNDLVRGRPLRKWADDMTALVAALRDRYGRATVLVAGMPPVHRFPAVPRPLRLVLGARARAMDRLAGAAARSAGAVHVPMDEAMARDRRLFASDGFHPSPAGYRAWAEDLARALPARTVP
ncbi:SGNH/GDSL hydrolase family protein [Actinomadura graeca]|uniref:SGNH/GDSL hydrolase family protein n=1 Tax=Actinomadura graeca TaxID=2750812 RepID=A0ABX8R184_9ACTN|nr:SGNH/GDSL hydrolase family protein [Actinomadura graeca]QXJ24311.1 SGNH/GDSL hydrolase family protein [Actinomadura graeca]